MASAQQIEDDARQAWSDYYKVQYGTYHIMTYNEEGVRRSAFVAGYKAGREDGRNG